MSKQNNKIFLFEDFFHLPPVLMTPVVHLEPQISPRIFEKIWNGRNGIFRCLGETDFWKKNRSRKSRGTVPLRQARSHKNLEKRGKFSFVWRWEEVTKWRQVGVPRPAFFDSITSPRPRTTSDGISGRAQKRRDDKLSLKQKGSQML